MEIGAEAENIEIVTSRKFLHFNKISTVSVNLAGKDVSKYVNGYRSE